jgi:hypothetical protein
MNGCPTIRRLDGDTSSSRFPENKINIVRFQVLTAASMKMAVFWVVVPDYTAQQPRRQPSKYI